MSNPPTDELDDLIRAELATMVAESPPLAVTPPATAGSVLGPSARRAIAVAAAIAVVVGGAVAAMTLRGSDGNDRAASGRAAGTDAPVAGSPVTPGRLAVAEGASDYYVGPEELGMPTFDLSLFDTIARCAELDADGVCTRLEGIGWVPIVEYRRPWGEPSVFGGNPRRVAVGTTFGLGAAAEHAAAIAGASEPVEIRGAEGVTVVQGDVITVLWDERPDVVAWVSGTAVSLDELLEVAEGVRLVDGPATISDVVAIPGTASSPAVGNSAAGIVVARGIDGEECVGMRFLDDERACPAAVATMTWVDARIDVVDDGFAVTGAAPSEVAAVRLTPRGGAARTIEPFEFGPFHHRFFRVDMEPTVALTVEWLDEHGGVLSATDRVGSGSGYGVRTAYVIDGSLVPGAGANLAALMTGAYRGQEFVSLARTGLPVELIAAAAGIEQTTVYYGYSSGDDVPAEATTLAAWLGAADVRRASEELTRTVLGYDCSPEWDCTTGDVVVILGRDQGIAWAPGL